MAGIWGSEDEVLLPKSPPLFYKAERLTNTGFISGENLNAVLKTLGLAETVRHACFQLDMRWAHGISYCRRYLFATPCQRPPTLSILFATFIQDHSFSKPKHKSSTLHLTLTTKQKEIAIGTSASNAAGAFP